METISAPWIAKLFERARLLRLADGLVVAIAVSLPWSTSATSILIAAWLLVLIPLLDTAALRQGLATPAGWLPVALWTLALIGMLWSIGPLPERISSFQAFIRLLAIPLLLIQFRQSDRGLLVVGAFLVSCTALLTASWVLWFVPALQLHASPPGVPVKDYIVQSGEFVLCAYAIGHWACDAWREGARRLVVLLAVFGFLFLLNVGFVATGRSSLVVLGALLVVFALQRFEWRSAIVVVVLGAGLAAAFWASSTYLRGRVLGVLEEVRTYQTENAENSSAYRLEFWKKSIDFFVASPIIGHGTGATKELFRRVASGVGPSAAAPDNPHNQTLVIAVQHGIVGVALLYAMWFYHLTLFWGRGLIMWLGFGVVVQNIVASLFNSQIFYFTPGWIYVFGVGVLGGMALAAKERAPDRPA